MQQEIANRLNVARSSVDGWVLGEHGDSEVAVCSSIRVGGMPMDRFAAGVLDEKDLARDVRDAGYRIIEGKGYTSFGIATAAVRICEAILHDERVVLPVSALLSGQFGLSDLYLSLPSMIGSGGIEQILMPDLSPSETAALLRSADVVRAAIDVLART